MDTNTIGKAIGVVGHVFSITNDRGEKVTLNIKIDFRTCTDQELKGWLTSNRIIAGQRPWRALSEGELKELHNKTFNANTIGQKVKSREEQKRAMVEAFINAGASEGKAEELATAAMNDPDTLEVVRQ